MNNIGTVGKTYRLALLLLVGISLSGFAQEGGTVDFFDGSVDLIRADEVLDETVLIFGEVVSPGETVRTGSNGHAELSISSPRPVKITVDEDTAYTLSEVSGTGSGSSEADATGIRLVYGKVSIAVEKSVGESAVEVRAGKAVFGVRGTTFDVVTAPDGAVLMGVREGTVETRTPSGLTDARSGQAVEVLPEGNFSRIDVPQGRLGEYYDAWRRLRGEVFQNDPAFFVSRYLERHGTTERRFARAADALFGVATEIRRMVEEGVSRSERVRLRMSVATAVVNARSARTLYEEALYSLSDLVVFLDAENHQALTEAQQARVRLFKSRQGDEFSRLARVNNLIRIYDSFDIGASLPDR